MSACYHPIPTRFRMADSPLDDAAAEGQESDITFVGFVLSLAHTAAVHFGDVVDPVSGEVGQVNLAAAKQMIDILALLEEKTRGNLSAEERQLLEQMVFELRMRFVQASQDDPAPPSSRIILP